MNNKKQGYNFLILQIVTFIAVFFVLWLDDYVDIPALYYQAPRGPYRFFEYIFETITVAIVAVISIIITIYLQLRIRRLEEFIRVCGWCKKVYAGDKWVPFEDYMEKTYQLQSSHGICDSCKHTLMNNAQKKRE